MKHTIHLLLTLSLIAFLSSSCSQKGGKSEAQIQLFSGHLAISSYSGGAMIWGSNKSGTDAFARVLTSGSFAIELNNGVWDFMVIGWDGSTPMTGTPSCATAADVKLEGKEINVSLSLSNASCNSPLISQNAKPGMGANTFPSIKTQTCNQRAVLDGVTYCDGEKLGAATSMKVYFPEYDKTAGNLSLKASGISGACLQTNPAPAVGDEGKSTFSANIPTGGASSGLFTIMRQYLGSQDCQSLDTTGTVFDARLPNGLAAPAGTRHFYGNQTLTGTAPSEYYTALFQLELSDSSVCSGARLTSSSFASGKGDAGRPYIICNHHQLDSIGGSNWSGNASKHFALGATIDYFKGNGITLTEDMADGPQYPDSIALGSDFIGFANEAVSYSGTFNGRGHKIIGFQLNTSEEENEITDIGFIRRIAAGGIVQNITFVLPSIEASTDKDYIHGRIGTVAGSNLGLVHKVKIIEGDVEGYSRVGGIVGLNNNVIQNSQFQGEVSGTEIVGGLVGEINQNAGNTSLSRNIFNGLVKSRSHEEAHCSNPSFSDELTCTAPDVWYESRYFGGAVGKLAGCDPEVEIDQIAVHGNIEGTTKTGGLVGGITAASGCEVTHSIVTANVKGDDNMSVAGLIGSSSSPSSFSINFLLRMEGSTTTPNGTAPEAYNGSPASATYTYVHSTESYSDLRQSSYYSLWPITGPTPIFVFDDDGQDFPRLSIEPKRFCSGKMAGVFAGGTGAQTTPYLICTREQFQNIQTQLTANKHFKLMRNIDFSGFTTADSAYIYSASDSFTGTIDGNDFAITNYSLSGTARSLIYKTSPSSLIKNLSVYGKNLTTSTGSVGGIVYEHKGVLENVKASGHINNSMAGAGCITYINYGVISGAHASCSMEINGSSRTWIGGIAGRNAGLILYSEFDGDISILAENSEFIGGLAGIDLAPTESGSYYDSVSSTYISRATPKIYESTFRGKIALNGTNTQKVGGIIGLSTNSTDIKNNMVEGTVQVDLSSSTNYYNFLGNYDATMAMPNLSGGGSLNDAYLVQGSGTNPSGGPMLNVNDVIYWDGSSWMVILNGATQSGKVLLDNSPGLSGAMPRPQYIGGVAGLAQGGTIVNNFSNIHFDFLSTPPNLVTSTWGSLVGDSISATFTGNLAFKGMLPGSFNNDHVEALASYGMSGGAIHTLTEIGLVSTSATDTINTQATVSGVDVNDFLSVAQYSYLEVLDLPSATEIQTDQTVAGLPFGTPIYRLDPVSNNTEALTLFQDNLLWNVSEDSDSGTIWAIEDNSRPHLSRAHRANDARRMPYYIDLYNQYR